MSGRGCAITVYVNPGSSANTAIILGERTAVTHIQEHENGMVGWVLPLFVALHTPLEVLRGQLEEQSGFAPELQVLILCDLTDKDRNHDQLLDDQYDHCSLYDCNIREGSILSLHRIGTSGSKTEGEEDEENIASSSIPAVETHLITTPISAAQADHSYNGIIFDIESKGPFELDILSLAVGGMLGRVRIYTRAGSYEQFETDSQPNERWWAHHSSISPDGWELIVDQVVKASWDTPSEVHFDKKVTVLPRKRQAFYIHSGLPDDLGIQYQSYNEDDVVAESDHLVILPGLGHTGSDPFDEVNGWYRAFRGLAGTVRYSARLKGWDIWEHANFPVPLRRAVHTMLLLNAQASNMILEHRLNNLSLDHENNPPERQRPLLTAANYYHFPTSNYMPVDAYDLEAIADVPPGVRLMSVPLYVVYYIMEFMHWDWFEELYTNQDRGYRLMDSHDEGDDFDEEDDEYERFSSRGYGGGGSGSGGGGRRSRASRERARKHESHARTMRGGQRGHSSAASQQTIARLLTHMFMQQQSEQGEDEEGEEEEQELVIDAHMLHVMNSMFGGGINQFLGGGMHLQDSSEDMDEEEEEEEEEETKEDIYASVNNDSSASSSSSSSSSSGGGGGGAWSSIASHPRVNNTVEEEEAEVEDLLETSYDYHLNNDGDGDHDDDDDYDDDNDEAYSQLSSSRYS